MMSAIIKNTKLCKINYAAYDWNTSFRMFIFAEITRKLLLIKLTVWLRFVRGYVFATHLECLLMRCTYDNQVNIYNCMFEWKECCNIVKFLLLKSTKLYENL